MYLLISLLVVSVDHQCRGLGYIVELYALEHGVSFALSRVIDVGIVQKVLNSQKNLIMFVCHSYAEKVVSQRTCLIVIAGFQDFSSSRIDKQTVPDG